MEAVKKRCATCLYEESPSDHLPCRECLSRVDYDLWQSADLIKEMSQREACDRIDAGQTIAEVWSQAQAEKLDKELMCMAVSPGTKFDVGKLRLDLIDPLFEEYTAIGLGYGANKYSADNWLKGIQFSRVYGALRRHLRSWYLGEETDPESGNPHLAHAACMLQFLIRYAHDPKYKEFDDRLFVEVKEDSDV